METKNIIPELSINYKNLDVDLQERLRKIISNIQKISSKIGIHSILQESFNRDEYFKKICKEICLLEGRSDTCEFQDFKTDEICFILRIPRSLYSKHINIDDYPVQEAIIFCTFDRAFFFDPNYWEVVEDRSNHKHIVYDPEFRNWEKVIMQTQKIIKRLQEEIPIV